MRNEWINAKKAQVLRVIPINKNWTMQVLFMPEGNGRPELGETTFAGFRMIERKGKNAETTKHAHVEYDRERKILIWDEEVPASVRKAAKEYCLKEKIVRRASISIPILLDELNAAYSILQELESIHTTILAGKAGNSLRVRAASYKQSSQAAYKQIEKYADLIEPADPAYYSDYVNYYPNVMEYVSRETITN